MIETRNGNLVVSNKSILVREVTSSICDRQPMDWLLKRFPLTTEDIFECVSTISDLDDFDNSQHIKIVNDGDAQDIQLRTTAISDTMFLKLISFGRIFSPNVENIDELYNIGFKQVAIECYTDLVEGNLDFENSELHDIVFQAFDKCLENTARPEVILELLQEDETT